jgi:hypothetical protein
MRPKKIAIIGVVLMLSLANFSRLKGNENIRTIQFLSIFVIGLLAGLLLSELGLMFKAKKDNP